MRRLKTSKLKKPIIYSIIILSLLMSLYLANIYIHKNIEKINKISEYLLLVNYFSGLNKPLRILVLFQNNAEARYGGGFIGTIGLVDVDRAKIKPVSIRSVYYYDHKAEVPGYYIEKKKTLDGKLTDMPYTLRDSGQNVSWPTNAKRAQNIFEKESGVKSDLVIGVTPEVLKVLLEILGPVYLEDYNKTVSSSNLIESVQLEVESGKDKLERRDPKSILTSLSNALLKKISSKNLIDIMALNEIIAKMVQQRQIVFFSNNEKIQQIMDNNNATGKIVSYNGDYLQMSEKSISGTKTGPYMVRNLERSIEIGETGKVITSLILKRQHTASERLYKYFDPVLGGYNYLVGHDEVEMKIILPKGTRILSSSVDINLVDKEEYYDVYSYRILTDVNSSSEVRIKLMSPFTNFITDKFQFNSYLQKAVGSFPINLRDCIKVPSGYYLQSSNINFEENSESKELCYDAKIDKDYELKAVYAKKR